jgi:hypothetical protein
MSQISQRTITEVKAIIIGTTSRNLCMKCSNVHQKPFSRWKEKEIDIVAGLSIYSKLTSAYV